MSDRRSTSRRRPPARRLLFAAAAAASLVGCEAAHGPSIAPAQEGAEQVAVAIRNTGTTPLRCTIIFGHWVEQALGEIAPGGAVETAFQRQVGDGALFVPRYDGRRMMVENLICGPLTGWWEGRADISLLPLRGEAPAGPVVVACRQVEERARCGTLRPASGDIAQ